MDINEIFEYCKQRHVHLCSEKNYDACPYREAYKDRYFCTISDFLLDYYVGGGYQKDINLYFEQACASVRQELIGQKEISEEAKIRRENLLNNANVGDRVFCIPKCDDVILLEKSVDFSGRCRCKALDGEELLVFPDDLNPIAKGTKCALYKTNFVEEFLEFSARKLGFRVERKLADGMFVFKFYGDTQQEVDDFLSILKSKEKEKK